MAEARTKPRRSLWQRALAVIFVIVATPMLFAAALRTPAVREYARQEAARAIRTELGLSALISDVDIDPKSLALVAHGITLDHPQHGRFVDAKVLRIRPSWFALLQGKLDLHHITIDQASLWLLVRDGQLVNGPKTAPSEGGGQSVDLPFNMLWIKRSRVIVDAQPQARGELNSIDIFLDSTQRDVLGIELSAQRGLVKHEKGQDDLERLEARAKLTDHNVQVELLRVRSPTFRVALRQSSFEWPIGSSYHGELDLSLELSQLAHLPVEMPPMQGALHVRGSVVHDAEGTRGDAKIALHRGGIMEYGFGEDTHLDLKLQGKKVLFNGSTTLIDEGGRVDLDGSLSFDEGMPLSVRARADGVGFAKLMKQLSVSPDAIVDWNLNGNFELHGTLSPFMLKGPLRMPTRDFRILRDAWHVTPARLVMGVDSANLVGQVVVDPKGILLRQIDVGMRRSKLRVQEVLIGFDNHLRVRATGETLDLADVSPLVGFSLSGLGAFTVNVAGEFTDPKVTGHMRFDDFAFASYPFGDVESDFVLEKDVQAVRFPELVAKKNESRYRAKDFVLDFSDRRLAIAADARFQSFALQDFYHVFHYENDERYVSYQGVVSGDAKIRYTMGFPSDGPNGTMLADMDLDIEEAELSGFQFSGGHFAGRWNWRDHARGYRAGQLTVERLSLQKGPGTINISGKMLDGGRLDMVVVGDKIAVRDTEGLAERLPDLSGQFAITGTVKGDAALPRAEVELTTAGLAYAGEALGDGRLYVRHTDQGDPWVSAALTWPQGAPPADEPCGHAREGLARGSWPADPPINTSSGPQVALDAPMAYLVCGQALDGKLTLDLAVGRTRMYPLRGDVSFTGLPFGKFLSKRKKNEALSGELTGRLRLRGGAMLTPSTLAGDVRLDTLKVGQLGVTLRNDGPVLASFERGSFAIERASFAGPSTALHIAGGGSLQAGLGLQLAGSVDVGILSSFSRELQRASGKLDLDFKVSGQLDRPAVFGRARLQGGSVQLAAFPHPVSDIQGVVTFSAQRVIFESFSARVLGGVLGLSGVAALQGRDLGSYRFELEAERLTLAPKEGIELVVGGQGELDWQRGERLPKLSGTLRLDRMKYSRPINMGRTLTDFTKKARADVEAYDPDADLLALDLRVVQSEPVHIQNNLIDAQISIDDKKEAFRLVGTDQRFGLLGDMSIRRGTVRLRDTAFAIKAGEINFDSAVRIEPSFDVHAVTDVRRNAELGQTNWHIGVHAWGTPDSFQFNLTSDPYLSEDDIALLLALGMTHTELAQLQTSDLTGTAALEALATVTGVEREVQRALPAIDDVHIASSYSARSNRTEPQLHLGKRIADRVRLDASTGLSESRDFSTGVEYQISDKTSLGAVYNNQTSTSASQLGDVGVDLKWRLEFD